MNCSNGCFEAIIESCNDIVVRAVFPPNFPLYWIISKEGRPNIYQRLVNTNGSGDLIILKSDLPPGFLITGNHYKIRVKNGTDYLQPVTLFFGGTQYTCITTELIDIGRLETDNSEVNVIEFKQALIPAGSSGNVDAIVYAFVNQVSFTYTHNLGRIVSATIYDLAGELIAATITDDIINHNFITVTFTSPTSGRLLIL